MGSNAITPASMRRSMASSVSSSGSHARRQIPACSPTITRGHCIRIPPGSRMDHTPIPSPLGRPCQASPSSISLMLHPRSPVDGPHVHDVPAHFLCQWNGGTPRKNLGLPWVGGVASSAAALGGPSRSASRQTMVRNSLRPCGGHDPGSTPASHTGACWKMTRTRPSPCRRMSSVDMAPLRRRVGPMTIPTLASRFRPKLPNEYCATGIALTSSESKQVSQSAATLPVTILWICVHDVPPSPPSRLRSTLATVLSITSPM
mmetsp:Transcript_6174/g.17263  ORF Transcript_6174/g.17263 Transcript_6174/m.17263 type:complete len:260 (-) Transcript_6174:314-1093(-)